MGKQAEHKAVKLSPRAGKLLVKLLADHKQRLLHLERQNQYLAQAHRQQEKLISQLEKRVAAQEQTTEKLTQKVQWLGDDFAWLDKKAKGAVKGILHKLGLVSAKFTIYKQHLQF